MKARIIQIMFARLHALIIFGNKTGDSLKNRLKASSFGNKFTVKSTYYIAFLLTTYFLLISRSLVRAQQTEPYIVSHKDVACRE
jgi:hypothetical protein